MSKYSILYEDNQIIAVHKDAGLATQTRKLGEKDLYSEVMNYLAKSMKSPYLAIINRLDQPVSGIVLMAKTKEMAAKLSKLIVTDKISKYYEATVYGDISELAKNALIDEVQSEFPHFLKDYVIQDTKSNISKVCDATQAGAKEASLEYTIKEVLSNKSVIRIHLITGRHHQIRLQLSNRGYPILGDKKYGTDESIEYSRQLGMKNIALCAYRMEFIHPDTKKSVIISENID